MVLLLMAVEVTYLQKQRRHTQHVIMKICIHNDTTSSNHHGGGGVGVGVGKTTLEFTLVVESGRMTMEY